MNCVIYKTWPRGFNAKTNGTEKIDEDKIYMWKTEKVINIEREMKAKECGKRNKKYKYGNVEKKRKRFLKSISL